MHSAYTNTASANSTVYGRTTQLRMAFAVVMSVHPFVALVSSAEVVPDIEICFAPYRRMISLVLDAKFCGPEFGVHPE